MSALLNFAMKKTTFWLHAPDVRHARHGVPVVLAGFKAAPAATSEQYDETFAAPRRWASGRRKDSPTTSLSARR
jgi:hypothetical protein